MDELTRLELVFERNIKELSRTDPLSPGYARLKVENQRNLEERRRLLGL